MDPACLLSALRTLPDVCHLLRWLGHHADWRELDPQILAPQSTRAGWAGNQGGFEWLALEAAEAASLGRRLANRLAGTGRLAGVLAFDPQARRLDVTIVIGEAVEGRFDLDAPSPASLERLHRLAALRGVTGLEFGLRATEVLGGVDAGRRFFLAFRDILERMAAEITLPPRETDRPALALLQLTRVLFLYFVQAKGWLNGETDFLRRWLDDRLARRRPLHRDLFRPLFFGTLNRPAPERGRAAAFGRIPFLNGGLFEPHQLERHWRGTVPNLAWREAFDQLFERFHFTVDERGSPGRIAPDMLGRVFEGLMAPADRRETGAFYTPAALVPRLVEAGLTALVAQRLALPRSEAVARLARPDQSVLALLQTVTVLDPAVGSGAFLLGVLDRLAALRVGEAPPAQLRRRILERNLFGVDLNPMAVRLAELRLWLRVVVDESTSDPISVAPLPNLDGVIRQGDSLLDPAWLLGTLGARAVRVAPEVRHCRHDFVSATGPRKAELLRQLRRIECRALAECLEEAATTLDLQLAECLASARAPTLFGDRRGLDRRLRTRLSVLRRRQARIRSLGRRLRREGELPWFSFEGQFGDVMAAGGFDLVVGNPPWVRAEQLAPRYRTMLAERYRWWRTAGRGFRHQPDLALAFAERSAELLAPRGVLALLLPAKVATAEYARRFREALAGGFTLHHLADLGNDPAATFDATTYPAALVAARARPGPQQTVTLSLDPSPEAEATPQAQFTGGTPWLLWPDLVRKALALVNAEHPTLGRQFTPRLGMKTGANAVFLDPPTPVEPSLIRRAIRGRDVRPFRAGPGVRLFFPCDSSGRPYARLPPEAARHVREHAAVLQARVDYRDGPLWTLFRVAGAVAPYRVIWSDLARRLAAVPLTAAHDADLIPLNTCYLVALPDPASAMALAAWLNSTWLRAAARAAADPAASGFARFNARVVAALPLPEGVLRDSTLVGLGRRGVAGEPVQEEIDAYVAEYLQLPAPACEALVALGGGGPADRGRVADRGR
jgi:methylase of polypeptide subunit release factors